MSSVDLGGATLVLNDEDYQRLREHAKGKHIVSQYGFDIKHKRTYLNWRKSSKVLVKILKHVVKLQVKYRV